MRAKSTALYDKGYLKTGECYTLFDILQRIQGLAVLEEGEMEMGSRALPGIPGKAYGRSLVDEGTFLHGDGA